MTYHNEEARVGVDHFGLVSGLQIPEDRSIVEEGQVDHVLALLELGRVDLADLSSLVGELLVTDGNDALAGGVLDVSGLQQSLPVSSSLGAGNPDRLLSVVRLLLVRSLHLDGGQQELRGVGVHGPLHQLDMAGHVVTYSRGREKLIRNTARVIPVTCQVLSLSVRLVRSSPVQVYIAGRPEGRGQGPVRW